VAIVTPVGLVADFLSHLTCPVEGNYLATAVNLVPCGHNINESSARKIYGEIIEKGCANPSPCPVCEKEVTTYTPDSAVRDLVKNGLEHQSELESLLNRIESLKKLEEGPALPYPGPSAILVHVDGVWDSHLDRLQFGMSRWLRFESITENSALKWVSLLESNTGRVHFKIAFRRELKDYLRAKGFYFDHIFENVCVTYGTKQLRQLFHIMAMHNEFPSEQFHLIRGIIAELFFREEIKPILERDAHHTLTPLWDRFHLTPLANAVSLMPCGHNVNEFFARFKQRLCFVCRSPCVSYSEDERIRELVSFVFGETELPKKPLVLKREKITLPYPGVPAVFAYSNPGWQRGDLGPSALYMKFESTTEGSAITEFSLCGYSGDWSLKILASFNERSEKEMAKYLIAHEIPYEGCSTYDTRNLRLLQTFFNLIETHNQIPEPQLSQMKEIIKKGKCPMSPEEEANEQYWREINQSLWEKYGNAH
jgi:hypothetical protein